MTDDQSFYEHKCTDRATSCQENRVQIKLVERELL